MLDCRNNSKACPRFVPVKKLNVHCMYVIVWLTWVNMGCLCHSQHKDIASERQAESDRERASGHRDRHMVAWRQQPLSCLLLSHTDYPPRHTAAIH